MLSAEGIGKNIEKAIENALLELKASREDVDIKILSEGGLFKKAKVVVTISEDAREKYEKKTKKELKNLDESTKKEENINVEKENIVEDVVEKTEESKPKIKQESTEEKIEKPKLEKEKTVDVLNFLKGLFEKVGKTVEINIKDDDKYITYSVVGEDLGDMIGHRGECYYAISKLLSVMNNDNDKKILLDIGGFKEKRAENLTALAKRIANKVIKTGRYVKLDPMNPSDRRIIHTALQDNDKVTTLSKGTEPHRYVIIFPKESE